MKPINLKVLLVDDNPGDRVLFKSKFRKSGYDLNLLEASNANDALSLLHANDDINCVFLDYMLPDMDGITVLKKIYDKNTDLAPFPVVMLTGQGSESVAIDAIRYGAQDYLIKDHITTDTLYIALAKAKEIFELKKSRNEAISLLEHSQKMEAVGKLTGGIAHDFNNLLTITFGNARLLEILVNKNTLNPEQILEKVRNIQKATKRGSDLVKKLMVFSRQRTLEPQVINMNDLISELIDLLQKSLGDSVEIQTDFATKEAWVEVDPGQLEHAIINMAVNARDVMPDGGSFILETKVIFLDESESRVLNLPNGQYVKLTLSDSGYGMDHEVMEKVFEPFFTTKDIGKGTGLGLSMVYGFIHESEGAITVNSEIGSGTSFHLYFPHCNEVSTQVEHQVCDDNPAEQLRGSETILVVEDEDDIRFLNVNMLKEMGYNVLEASNGTQALEIIKQTRNIIDLIFTDIAMPGGMNGVQMAARAEVLKPHIKLLFTSGYASASTLDMNLIERYPLLNKPYQPEDLIKKLREVLDA